MAPWNSDRVMHHSILVLIFFFAGYLTYLYSGMCPIWVTSIKCVFSIHIDSFETSLLSGSSPFHYKQCLLIINIVVFKCLYFLFSFFFILRFSYNPNPTLNIKACLRLNLLREKWGNCLGLEPQTWACLVYSFTLEKPALEWIFCLHEMN